MPPVAPRSLAATLEKTTKTQIPGMAIRKTSVSDICAHYGLGKPSISGDRIICSKSGTSLTFTTDNRRITFNGIVLLLNQPVTRSHGDWIVSTTDISGVITPLLSPAKSVSHPPFTVFLDPGHGGNDTGAIGKRKVYEKKVVLDIAKRIISALQSPDITIKLTRYHDSTLSLRRRTEIARKSKADIFISIHLNSARNRNAKGVETFVLPSEGSPSSAGTSRDLAYRPGNKFNPENTALAYEIHRNVLFSTAAEDRGVRRARFDVLCNAPCPAALIECGFVSNAHEENLFISAAYRQKIADGIAQGITAYLSR